MEVAGFSETSGNFKRIRDAKYKTFHVYLFLKLWFSREKVEGIMWNRLTEKYARLGEI
jgi:hypothetical protein